MKKRFISLLVIFLFIDIISAQNLTRLINDKQYNAQVKIVDEFRARFNGNEQRIDVLKEDSTWKLQLLLLCNGERYMTDTLFQYRYNMFLNTIVANNIHLNYFDSMWYATAVCNAEIAGKSSQITLYLSVEPRENDMYKWVISDVEGEIFELGEYERSNDLFLLPNQHEQNFMELVRTTTEMNKYITFFSKNSYQLNRLDVFNTLVYNKRLQIKSVGKLTFTFLQVPNYAFTIEYFARESLSSGWLINDVQEMTDKEKEGVLNKIH